MIFNLLKKYWFLFVIILIHLFFWITAIILGNIFLKDSTEYLFQALNLKTCGSWYSGDLSFFDPDLVSRRPPLYGFFICVLKIIYNSNYFILLIQNILSIITLSGTTTLIGGYISRSKAKKLTLICFLFLPAQFIYANMIMSELLFETLFFSAFFCLVCFLYNKRTNFILFYNLLLGLAILTRPMLYPFWMISLFFLIFLYLRKKLTTIQLATGVIPLLFVVSVSTHNYFATGYYHYSSLGKTNFLSYNAGYTLETKSGKEAADAELKRIGDEAAKHENYKKRSEYIEHEIARILSENIFIYSMIELKGIVHFFLDPGRFGIYSFFVNEYRQSDEGILFHFKKSGIRGTLYYISGFPLLLTLYLAACYLFNGILFCAFILFLFQKKTMPEVRLITALMVFYIAIVTGPVGDARYRMAVFPEMIFAAVLVLKNKNRDRGH